MQQEAERVAAVPVVPEAFDAVLRVGGVGGAARAAGVRKGVGEEEGGVGAEVGCVCGGDVDGGVWGVVAGEEGG